MATVVAHPSVSTKPSIDLPGRRYDHLFFSALALLILATVFVGFARTYYFAGVFHAPLPSLIIHVHGAAFSCWILLLVTDFGAGQFLGELSADQSRLEVRTVVPCGKRGMRNV
jgi:hypothetical protein